VPYKLAAYWAELLEPGQDIGGFLGITEAGSNGRLIGEGAVNPHDVRVTIDNRNVGGVGPGTGADSGSGAYQGVEFAIPLAAIGNPTGCIRLCAFVNGVDHDFVSNQVLPPLPAGTDYLGEPRNVDFSAFAGNQFLEYCPQGAVGVEDDHPPHGGHAFALHAPYPNPFNPRTSIAFSLEADAEVTLEIYDVAGRKVATLIDGESLRAGTHVRTWEARDARGRTVASGTYMVRMRAGSFVGVKRLTLLK
jgi:hypothetical protein